MGLINSSLTGALSIVGLGSLTQKSVKPPSAFGPDFAEGFQIHEYVEGQIVESIALAGSFLPLSPFKFGGSQQISKQYYPGNSEPTVQILGSRESDLTITGHLKIKRIKDESMRALAVEYQKQIDAMRIRGNLVKIKLGEWYRYAFIDNVDFSMKNLRDIDYSITFTVIGFNPPRNSMFLSGSDENPVNPNKQLIARGAEILQAMRNYPESMPQDVMDILNNLIGEVAEAVNLVTGFVDGIVDDAEKLNASANRALGLVKNARAKVSSTMRRVGQIKLEASRLGTKFSTEASKTAATISNANHIHKIQDGSRTLASLLADLQAKFRAMTFMVPFKRHLVREGDTLQKISVTYYNTVDNWERIHAHNRLQSVTLTPGTVLEIPRV